MKKYFLLLIYLFAFYGCSAQTQDKLIEENAVIDTNKVIMPEMKHRREARIIATLFTRYHYKKINLNDSLSAVILNNYLKTLDNNKLYFYYDDIQKFQKYKDKLDDYLMLGDVDPFYKIFNVYKQRVNERVKYALKRLKEGFDFNKDEYFTPDRKNAGYPKTREEMDELWRKRLKNDALNLKLNGKKWDGIVETLSERYKRFQKVILQYKAEDVFQLAMNAFAESIDPHSNYFSPLTSQNFKINMSLSFEGIGAVLTTKGDYTQVVRIIPGGPAYKSGKLHADDKIIGVGQGKDGKIVDVIGWRIDDVIQLIRGKKGTTVRLVIQKASAGPGMPPDTISIVRGKVKLEGQASKKEIVKIKHNGKEYKIGVINVPAFYIDFDARRRGDKNYKSTTRDVKRIIAELKKDSVKGIIIDLRNNGGGSLQEAIDMVGLFIPEGPVVQVKNSVGKIEVDKDTDPATYYTGPLAVLVNRYSASASEIFAGAIQDYGRGLIIGEETYGKGTVQNLIDLDRFISDDSKLGQVKLTIAKFYRITGSSTQKLGVIPDIEFPSPVPPEESGESAQPSALKWDRIPPSNFKKYGNIQSLVPKLVKLYKERIKHEPEFQIYLKEVNEALKMRKKKKYSLNEKIRKAEREKAEKEEKARKEAEKKSEAKITVYENDGKTKTERLEDPELHEACHILADFIELTGGKFGNQ